MLSFGFSFLLCGTTVPSIGKVMKSRVLLAIVKLRLKIVITSV